MDIYVACKAGDIAKVQFYVEALGFDINKRDEFDSTPLYYACLCGHANIVRYLLDAGAKLIRGQFDTERAYYAALTDQIRNILEYYSAIPNRSYPAVDVLTHLRESNLYTDIAFSVEGQLMPAHKFVLFARSPFLAELLGSRWCHRERVNFASEKLTAPAFETFLNFVYENILDFPVEIAADVMRILRFVKMGDVADVVEKETQKDKQRIILNFNETSPFYVSTCMRQMYFHVVLNDENEVAKSNEELANTSDPESYARLKVKYKFSDICIEMLENGKTHRFFGHRALLSYHSGFFNALLTSNFKEKQLLESRQTFIPIVPLTEIEGCSMECMNIIMEFMYTCALPEGLAEDMLIELLVASTTLLISSAQKAITNRLARILTTENVLSILELAELYDADRLKDAALEFIERNFVDIYHQPEFKRAFEGATGKTKEDFDRIIEEFEEQTGIDVKKSWLE